MFLLFIVFVLIFALLVGGVLAFDKYSGRGRVKKFASALETGPAADTIRFEADLLGTGDEKGLANLKKVLDRLSLTGKISKLLVQAGVGWSVTRFGLYSVVSALLGGWVGLMTQMAVNPELSALLLGSVFAMGPFGYLRFRRKKRIAAFEEQFPESLEFLSRALRAGHAFSMSLDLLARESPEPLASEFRRVYSEQNLGSPIEEALRNLAERVPLVDVGFFVSAVLLQRETGGNLTEILDNLAFIIRERFRLKGHVNATSASARMTGIILTLMPVGLAFLLNVVNPGYLETMVEDDLGQKLIVGAVVAQIIGYLIIKRIVDIKV